MVKYVPMDIKKADCIPSGLRMVTPPVISFKVVVELDKKMEKGVEKDPLLQQEFQGAAKEVYQQTCKSIKGRLTVFDKLFVGMADKGAKPKDMQKHLAGLNSAVKQDMKIAEKGAEIAVAKAWSRLQSRKKEWKNFKIKIGVTIAGTLAGMAVSIAAMATSPWSGGAGAAFGIMGLIKSGATLAKEIGKIAIDIDKSAKLLRLTLKGVEATAKKKGLFAANEVTAAVFQEFVGISQPSFKTCEAQVGVVRAKYSQLVVNVHRSSVTLNKILKAQEKLKKEFLANAAKKLQKHPTMNKPAQLKKIEGQLDKTLSTNYQKVDTQIKTVGVMYSNTKDWAPKVKTLIDRVDKLSKYDNKALKAFRETLSVAALATGALDGNKIASKASALGSGLGSAAGGYVYDKIVDAAIKDTVFDGG